jgi:signal transduction histidine kinase
MSPESLVDRLAALPVFAGVPRTELEWLASQGQLITIEAGARVEDHLSPTEDMFIVLSGRLALYIQKGGAPRKFSEGLPGQVLGTIPYSRFNRVPGTVVIEETMTAFVVHKQLFPVLIHDHDELTTALVHFMVDRARDFRAAQLNDDRLESLNRLASGFAHELNNPASAASRTALSLVGLIDEEEHAARELAAARLSDAELAALDKVRNECGQQAQLRTALEAADREEEIAEWLKRHDVPASAAEALAASNLSVASLDQLAKTLSPHAVGAAVRWVASGCATRVASRQIEVATRRIHNLVDAVKGFTFMDRGGMPDDVDIARGLADTLAMLEGKVRAKAADVRLETAESLPPVHGVGSEINQVWEKIVDNALDAISSQGHVTITASTRGDNVIVRVADDGPGIPEEIRPRIFEPFFTTKQVGKGAGLGLDIARRIVHLHRGDIEFSTQPGRTVFRVRLPAVATR